MNAKQIEKVIERYNIADQLITGGTDTAMCIFILQSYAGLTFNEAWVYLATEVFCWRDSLLGKSRQAIYRLKKSAQQKIAACEEPVLEMIRPFSVRPACIFID